MDTAMMVAELPAHIVSLVHGIGASLACYALFYACGVGLTPGAWDDAPDGDGFSLLLGTTVFVLWCWYGIQTGIPLAGLIVAFAGATTLVVGVRFRHVRATVRRQRAAGRRVFSWTLMFAAFYALSYLFLTPSVTDRFLQPVSLGNLDLLNYANVTRYAMRLGPSNIAGYSLMDRYYLQTPAVFSFLGLFAMLFGQDPLRATMPTLFAVIGLIGLVVARIANSVFSLSRVAAGIIAGVLISGPFFRYVTGHYFLSTVVAIPPLLYLLWTTAAYGAGRSFTDPRLVTRLFGVYVLLLFTYPVLLVLGVAAQVVAIVLTGVFTVLNGQDSPRRWRAEADRSTRTLVAAAAALAATLLCAPLHVQWVIAMLGDLSGTVTVGWPLDFISPLALIGVPGDVGRVQVNGLAHRTSAIITTCLLAVIMVVLGVWQCRRRTTPAERTFVVLAAGSLVAYCVVFTRLGPSYQQWKFASYLPLPLSFVLLAGTLRFWQLSPVSAFFRRSAWSRRVSTAVSAIVAASFIAGNVVVHATVEPPLQRLPGSLRNLALIEDLTGVREIYVKMGGSPANTFAAVYYIRNKELHLISDSYYPVEPMRRVQISRERPLLLQTDLPCESTGQGDAVAIPNVGCLLSAPPSPTLDVSYKFSVGFPFAEVVGLSYAEPFGRWNLAERVQLSIEADAQRFPVEGVGYLNLLVRPHLPAGTRQQRLIMFWGATRHASDALTSREWISLPVGRDDWIGARFKTLGVTLDLPDAIAPNTVDARVEDSRRLAVGFEELSMTRYPRGRTIPRSVVLDVRYPFSRTITAIETSGFYPPEEWGAWSRDPIVRLTLTAEDGQLPVSKPLYANVLVRTFLAPGTNRRPATFAWGAGRRDTGRTTAK